LPADVRGPFDVVFLAVKSQHTDAALDVVAGLIGPTSAVVSLQNGINEPGIAARIGRDRTIGAMVDFSADYEEPGRIIRGRRGNVFVGELDGSMTARLERIRQALDHAVPAHATDNIMGFVWAKVVKGSLDGTTALVDASIGDVRGSVTYRRALVEVIREGVLVARAEGVKVEAFDHFNPEPFVDTSPAGLEASYAVLAEMARGAVGDLKVRTGYWRDIVVRRRKTEIEYITGEIVRRGEKHGVPTPVNRRQLELFEDIEAGRRPMTWENLAELLNAIGQSATPDPRPIRTSSARSGLRRERADVLTSGFRTPWGCHSRRP
jgi:2-dehydropantoate 2-reductase